MKKSQLLLDSDELDKAISPNDDEVQDINRNTNDENTKTVTFGAEEQQEFEAYGGNDLDRNGNSAIAAATAVDGNFIENTDHPNIETLLSTYDLDRYSNILINEHGFEDVTILGALCDWFHTPEDSEVKTPEQLREQTLAVLFFLFSHFLNRYRPCFDKNKAIMYLFVYFEIDFGFQSCAKWTPKCLLQELESELSLPRDVVGKLLDCSLECKRILAESSSGGGNSHLLVNSEPEPTKGPADEVFINPKIDPMVTPVAPEIFEGDLNQAADNYLKIRAQESESASDSRPSSALGPRPELSSWKPLGAPTEESDNYTQLISTMEFSKGMLANAETNTGAEDFFGGQKKTESTAVTIDSGFGEGNVLDYIDGPGEPGMGGEGNVLDYIDGDKNDENDIDDEIIDDAEFATVANVVDEIVDDDLDSSPLDDLDKQFSANVNVTKSSTLTGLNDLLAGVGGPDGGKKGGVSFFTDPISAEAMTGEDHVEKSEIITFSRQCCFQCYKQFLVYAFLF